ncbi:ATP phosphoribosyltransferase [Kitasatospora sp. McL0602]|uniref:ATP phosphoribosyltransferase n=1 Tax=Kitasatospora sp. McL0602 TaxID=3439530 RepID=UPI003F8B9919
MIRLAVPKGRLWGDSTRLLQRLGMPIDARDRRYAFQHPTLELEAVALKIPDIPAAVADGLVDYAVASDEWLAEHDGRYDALTPLCWYHVRICVLAPELQADSFADRAARSVAAPRRALTVATPYPATAARLLNAPEAFRIRHVVGAVEAYPGRMTDLAVDCVESGDTARANNLAEVGELLRCDVRLVAGPSADTAHRAAVHLRTVVTAEAVDGSCTFGGALLPAGRP